MDSFLSLQTLINHGWGHQQREGEHNFSFIQILKLKYTQYYKNAWISVDKFNIVILRHAFMLQLLNYLSLWLYFNLKSNIIMK